MYQKLLSLVIRTLELCGFTPYKSSFKTILRMWCFTVHFTVLILLFLEIFSNFKGLDTIARASKLLPFLMLSGAKMLLAIHTEDSVVMMLEKTETDIHTIYSEETLKIGEGNIEGVHKMFRIFLVNTTATGIVLTIAMYFSRTPMVLTFREEQMGDLYWYFVFFLDLNFLIAQSLCTCGFSGIFIFFVAYIVTEMKMLKHAVSDGSTFRENDPKILVSYHVHLLSLMKDLISVYSVNLLVEYSLYLGSLCFNLFLWTMDSIPPDMKHTSDYGMIALYNITVLAFLSFSGDVVTENCEQLAHTFFHELTIPFLERDQRVASILMIQKAQKELSLTIGGFYNLNLMTFNMALVNCLRVVMFFRTLRENY